MKTQVLTQDQAKAAIACGIKFLRTRPGMLDKLEYVYSIKGRKYWAEQSHSEVMAAAETEH